MKTIRLNVFETNSSSEHALALISDEEFNLLNTNEIFISPYDGKIFDKETIWDEYVEMENNEPKFSKEEVMQAAIKYSKGDKNIDNDLYDCFCNMGFKQLSYVIENSSDYICSTRVINGTYVYALSWEYYC